MGSKISKSIGFFVPLDKTEKLFTEKLNEVIDDTFIQFDLIKKMAEEFDSFYKIMKTEHNFRFFSSAWQIKSLIKQDKINISEFLSSIYFGDDHKGFLFKTPELNKYSKSDDLIDYYENVDNPVYKIQYLKTNIYPEMSYVCLKNKSFSSSEALEIVREHNGKSIIEKHSFISYSDLNFILTADSDKQAIKNRNIQHLVNPENPQDKYFHYCIDPLCYIFAKSTGIIKKDMSYFDFIQYFEPAIITTWN